MDFYSQGSTVTKSLMEGAIRWKQETIRTVGEEKLSVGSRNVEER